MPTPLTLDEMDDRVAVLVRPVVERLGYLGDMLGIAARQPAVLIATMQLGAAVRSTLAESDFEALALTVSSATANRYEQYQHEQLCARRGYDDEWIRQCVQLQTDVLTDSDAASVLTDGQVLLRTLAIDCVRGIDQGASGSLAAVEVALGPAAAVAALQCIGYFVYVATVTNALAVASPVPPHLSGL